MWFTCVVYFILPYKSPISSSKKLLKNESIIYQYLNGCHNIPSVKWFGKDNNNYYMVIDLLGPSLQDLIETKNKLCFLQILTISIILQGCPKL